MKNFKVTVTMVEKGKESVHVFVTPGLSLELAESASYNLGFLINEATGHAKKIKDVAVEEVK